MKFLFAPYSLLLLTNTIFLFLIGTYIFNKRAVKGALEFAYLNFAAAFWSFCSVHEYAVYGAELKIVFSQLSYIGIVLIGYFWLLFALEYAQHSEKVIKFLRSALLVISALVLLGVFTNHLHGIIWPYTYQVPGSAYNPVIYGHGWGFYVNVLVIYSQVIAGIFILTQYGLSQSNTVKMQIVMAVVGITVPWIANIAYVLVLENVNGYDVTPFALCATTVLVTFALFRHNLFELLPTAKETVYQTLDSGIVVVDKNNVVVDINAFGRRILPAEIKIGTQLSEITQGKNKYVDRLSQILLENAKATTFYCERLEKWIEVRCYDLMLSGRKAEGKLYFFYDISRQQELYEELKANEFLWSSIIDFLPDPTFVVDSNRRLIIWNKAMEAMMKLPANKVLGKGIEEYAVAMYGKVRPTLVDVALNPAMDYSKYYKEISKKEDLVSSIVHRDGEFLWCVAKPLFDQSGKIIGAIESLRNITEQKKTEAELQDRLDTLLKLNDIMVKREARITNLSEELKKVKNR